MNEKLNHPDLSALFAKETAMSGAKAETFTKALFDIIVEGLEQDGIVKINGLGTFKITEVADRYSVNVNTGEKFEIKGHKKISFTPADTLKESVNRPFAMFEPVEVDENYQEETDNDADVPTSSIEENTEIAVPDDTVPVLEETTGSVADETIREESVTEETPIEERGKEEENIPQDVAAADTDDATEKKETPVKKSKKILRFAFYLILGFVCGFFVVKMLGRNHSADDLSAEMVEKNTSVQEVVAATDNEQAIAVEEIADSAFATGTEPITAIESAPANDEYAFIMLDELAARSDRSITAADTALYAATGKIATHVVVENERLAKISYDYYGSRKLWPYIAKHNKLEAPYGLAVGMELEIPALMPK